jgi:lauroyl/myristoyl acyltransferase
MTEEQTSERSDTDAGHQRWPIGFMLLIGATALYLGWRLIQGLGALVGWIAG